MDQPLVSVIVPIYNTEKQLSHCIESILAQTWQNLEIFLVNDGSTDNSLAICDTYRQKDPRIHLIDKKNAGVSDSRNRALEQAKGKYVQLVDSDDYIEPDYTRSMVEAAEATEADMVLSHFKIVVPPGLGMEWYIKNAIHTARQTKDGQKVAALEAETTGFSEGEEPEIREIGRLNFCLLTKKEFALVLMEKPSSQYYAMACNKLFRREIIERYNLRYPVDMTFGEDTIFNLQFAAKAERFCAIDCPGYYYVQNPQSICHNTSPMKAVRSKATLLKYYKEFFNNPDLDLGLKKLEVYKYLIDIPESNYSTSRFRKVLKNASRK